MASLLDLPYEILTYICVYLSYSDKVALGTTCKTLYNVCNQNRFIDKRVLKVANLTLSEECDPLLKLSKIVSDIKTIIFDKVEFSCKSKFWKDFGKEIKSLKFFECEISSDILLDILNHCPNLEKLKLASLNQFFMMFNSADYDIVLPSMNSLGLTSSCYITDKTFYTLVSMCPNLTSLTIRNCEDFCHPGIYNRFYPSSLVGPQEPSDSIFSFLFLSDTIRNSLNHITCLDFSFTMINGNYLINILETKNLKLESLNVSYCPQLRINNFIILSCLQPHLKSIALKNVHGCSMEVLTGKLPNLITLKIDGLHRSIKRCEIITPLNKLEELSMGNCVRESVTCMIDALLASHQPKLKHLNIEMVDLSQDTVLTVVTNLKKLTVLNLSGVVNGVNDFILRAIFENLVLLRELYLTNCEAITDGGLMGISYNPVPEIVSGNVPFLCIQLGSKMEIDIREDSSRKQKIIQYLDTTYEPNRPSIMRLQGLNVLSLKNCFKISDVSLKNVFKFKELVSLDISKCQQITVEGISAMVPNIPSLEYLNLSNCYNISDEAVDIICKGLPRLRTLSLNQNGQLTHATLNSFLSSKTLRGFSVQGCDKMNKEYALYVEEVLEKRKCL